MKPGDAGTPSYHPGIHLMKRQGNIRRCLLALALVLASLPVSGKSAAQGAAGAQRLDALDDSTARLNLALPTAGGVQLWTDHQWFYGWRLQQHALTGHWRLLDGADVRRSWGSRAACEAALQEVITAQDGPGATGPTRVVVLLHGLMRTHRSMRPLESCCERASDAQSIPFSYASTRFGIADHAAALRHWVETLPGRPRVDFVGHSMGNIVLRHAIGDWQRDGDPQQVLPRLGRVVMLGPPNQGATIARRLGALRLFEAVAGQGATELGLDWDHLEERLAVPPCPFAIVAGELPASAPQNPLVGGAGDFVVSVQEAQLPGATEMHTVPVLHSFLMDDPRVHEIVSRFLSP